MLLSTSTYSTTAAQYVPFQILLTFLLQDYHVIMIEKQTTPEQVLSYVYDPDTTLDFPCQFHKYVIAAIRSCQTLKPQYRR